jgi:hypothetical protein
MTRTKKNGMKTPGGRMAVVGALGLAALALAAVPAYAKGSVDITAPHTAQVGKTITVTAHGSDDDARYLQLCLEENGFGEGWHQEICSAVVATGSDARATAHGTSAKRGNLEFRAVMYGLTSPHDRHPVRLRTSDVATVHVR